MANLSLTTACNRACPYCFARVSSEASGPTETVMARELFVRALAFLRRSGIDQARLLGGEPTLHPRFLDFVNLALEQGLRVLVFSNGLMPEPVLAGLQAAPWRRVAVLINVPFPGESTPEESHRQAQVLQSLQHKAHLGFNIHTPGAQLDFLLELLAQHELAPIVRLGLAHPSIDGTNTFLPTRHYPEVGQKVAAFVERARDGGVAVELDCGFVPCMFPNGALEKMGKTRAEVGCRCGPTLDILPSGRVVSCYPTGALCSEPLPDDQDAESLRRRIADRLAPFRILGLMKPCSRCAAREQGECMGGCLAAAWRRVRHHDFAFTLPAPEAAIGCASATTTLRVLSATQSSQQQSPYETRAEWVVPYVDQALAFWQQLADEFGADVRLVYCPMPESDIGSGRPPQPSAHLQEFLRSGLFRCSVLVNPLVLPQPVEELAPVVVEALRRLVAEASVVEVTVANLLLATRIRAALPDLRIAASVLLNVTQPLQTLMIDDTCDVLVPAGGVLRDLAALRALRAAFPGSIRLIVNEGCLPGCPFRAQHFYEMGSLQTRHPRSLCDELLNRKPWLRLTGAWVLPQHLGLYDGLYDELKLAGRISLRDPNRYRRVLRAYVRRQRLTPDQIGGGPASVLEPLEIEDAFYERILACEHRCHECRACEEYYATALGNLRHNGLAVAEDVTPSQGLRT